MNRHHFSPNVVSTVTNAIDRVLANQVLQGLPAANELDRVDWDDVSNDLGHEADVDLAAAVSRRDNQTSASEADCAVRDPCFAQEGKNATLQVD
jgi:hypothetical protein